MTKQTPKLEWQMCDDEAEWRAAGSAALPAQPPLVPVRRTGGVLRRWRWWIGILLLVLLPTLVEGYREVRQADQTMDRVENDVRAAVVADDWIEKHDGNPAATALATSSSGPNITHRLGMEARRVEVRGDYAMVEVWTLEFAKPLPPAPFRQTRFYQKTEQGWLPVAPPDLFYQPVDTLQVGRFTFIYGPRDASTVLAAAGMVEAMDTELRMELGLPVTDEALTVRMVTELLPSLDPVELMRVSDGTELFAPSPVLLQLPAHISEEDALLQLVAGLLINRNVDEAFAGTPDDCRWRRVSTGLGFWLLGEYSELPTWSRYYSEILLQTRMALGNLPRLTELGPDPEKCLADTAVRRARGMSRNHSATVAFLDYATVAYGRDRLPALIEGMRRYGTWEGLIPTAFGVSATEFEAGWQEWLRKHEG